MISHGIAYLEERFERVGHAPLHGHLELTYRCDYACLHCCCRGSEGLGRELSTGEVKRILDELQREGCLWLALSGGDPLVRPDFEEIYGYAKRKGFLLTLLTNAYRLDRKLTDYLARFPPVSIDVTLNSLDPRGYARITGSPAGALAKVQENIRYASSKGLALIIKANAMKLNKEQLPRLKRWAHALPSKTPKKKLFNFRYDPILYPRFNGDTSPCRLRLDPEELDALYASDPDMAREKKGREKLRFPPGRTPHRTLYYCNTYLDSFYIDPFGRLKFCSNTDRFSADLRQVSFAQAFYRELPKLTRAKFKTDSPCRRCRLRKGCLSCPAAALLETGDEEAPVEYFCRMAHRDEEAACRGRR